MTTIDAHIGRRIRARRRQLKLKQSTVASAIGVTFQQVAKYEAGASRLSASRLFELCRCLDVAPSYFYESLA